MTTGSETGANWPSIDAVVFDVDGTLFDHVALRAPILLRLMRHLVTSRTGWRDLRTLRLFRRERDRLALDDVDDIGHRQFTDVAKKLRLSPGVVETIVQRWIFQEPLAFVTRYAMADAGRLVTKLQNNGIRTGVFSDYPAEEKLTAMGLAVEVVRDATNPEIGRLKPNPKGFLRVAELLKVSPQRCLIIGDRDDRDGEAARRGGFQFLRLVKRGRAAKAGEFSNYAMLIDEIEAHLGVAQQMNLT